MKVSTNSALTEQQKRDLRRLNNKKAAQRCRERKLEKVNKLENEVKVKDELIDSLKIQLEKYRSECRLMKGYLIAQGYNLHSIGVSDDIIFDNKSNLYPQRGNNTSSNDEIIMDKNVSSTSYNHQNFNTVISSKNYTTEIKQEYINENNFDNSQNNQFNQFQSGNINMFSSVMINNKNDDFYGSMIGSYEGNKSDYDINHEVSKIHLNDRNITGNQQQYNETINESFSNTQSNTFTTNIHQQPTIPKIARPSGFNFNMEKLNNEKVYYPLDIVTPQMPLFMDEHMMENYLQPTSSNLIDRY
uniref:BZIP domain-containing protein n=1 Tax=Parastrongyloides trichosuri TaxID=131310 RepID=A0A0N4Z967_PARTI